MEGHEPELTAVSRRRTLGVIAAGLLFYFVPIYLVITLPLPLPPLSKYEVPFDASLSETGPFVDNALFRVIPRPENYVHALISDEIDHIPENIPSEYLEELKATPDVVVTMTESFSYACLAINCYRYPFSIAGFRRALAFALDKDQLAALMYGELGYPLDNPIPPSCGIWHTNLTSPDYTRKSLASCTAELTAARFVDIDGDGYVEAPDETDFSFHVLYSNEEPRWEQLANAVRTSWDQAGLPVELQPVRLRQMSSILATLPRDYDGALIDFALDPPGPSPLALAAWSGNQTTSYRTNFLNWRNTTYDRHVTRLLGATEYDDVLAAAHAAQRVFVQQVPMVVLCGRYLLNAHRTDRFDVWVTSPGFGTGYGNSRVPLQVRLRPGDSERDRNDGRGGTFRSLIATDLDSQNPLLSTTVCGQYLLSQVYGSLAGLRDPLTHLATRAGGGLAYDWIVTELVDRLQFDFTLFDNATWHDGVPVTADDVVFSYNYIKDHGITTYLAATAHLEYCVAIDDEHVRILADDKSYWTFDQLSDWVILPEHIWKGIVSPERFANPEPIGFGPFRWDRAVKDESTELRSWELYHKGIPGHYAAVLSPLFASRVRLTLLGITVIALVSVSSFVYLHLPKRRCPPKG